MALTEQLMSQEQLNRIFYQAKDFIAARVHLETGKNPEDLTIDECPGCNGGTWVRNCNLHGLNGTHPR